MPIRPESPEDIPRIRDLITAAFLAAEHADGNEAEIVDGLRRNGMLTLGLVAEVSGRVVGYAAFSPVRMDGRPCGWMGLGPVAVDKAHRRAGIATALIDKGLEMLKSEGAAGCVVLGEPSFYGRFGFEARDTLRLADVPPEYFLCLGFDGAGASGTVTYDPAFHPP